MNLRSINLNLLPILRSLLHERSVSRAAAAIGISQPAASRALAQLRSILKDPLLAPTGRGLDRTALADSMLDTVDRLCRELDAVWRPESFDPASLRREFVLASADYAPIIMMAQLSARMLEEAPFVTLRFTDLAPSPTVSVPRGVDFIVVPELALNAHRANGGSDAPLFPDEFVPVVSVNHPLAVGSFCAEEIDSFPHVLFNEGENTGLLSDWAKDLDSRKPSKILAFVRHFGALPHLAISTKSVAIMPRRLAEVMIDDGLPIMILTEPKPRASVFLYLAWSSRFDSDAAHKWFRELVVATMTSVHTKS